MTMEFQAGADGTYGLILINGVEAVRITADGIVGGGGGGGGSFPRIGFIPHPHTITEDQVIAAGDNAISGGPMEVADGFEVTCADGSTWSVV